MKPSDSQLGHDPACPWHRRARDAVGYSLRIRLVLVFMALVALADRVSAWLRKALG